jgi:hypothetical protein
MVATFKMASIVKKCDFHLAVIYLFLCRFEQVKPFWACQTQLVYITDKKIKDETEIQDGVHSKKCDFFFSAVMYLFLGRFEQIIPFWTRHTQFYYTIDKKH